MKALFLLMPEGFRDEEFAVPKKRLEEAGVSVTVAGLEAGASRGMLGMSYVPEMLIDDVVVDDFDAVIVPGGSGSPRHMWNDPRVLSILKEACSKDKVVAAICLSGAVLANAGILEGRRATVYATPDSLEALRRGGAIYCRDGVVVDDKVVTADGPASAEKFASEILRLLG